MSGNDLAGKVAIITGGSAGIGRASVELFAERGAQVMVADVDEEGGAAVAAINPQQIEFLRTDVSDEGAVEALVAATVERFGKLDIMFNNAGGNGDLSPILDLSSDGFDGSLGLLARSVLAGHKHAARQFLKQGTGGSIISTSSAAGLQGGWAGAAYTAAKHAVIGIVRQATVELAHRGIRSNAICPGFTMTPRVALAFGSPSDRVDEYLPFLSERLANVQPLGRVGVPRDIAQVAAFLASDAASFVAGAVIPVDGGATAAYLAPFMDVAGQAAADFGASS